MKNAQTWAGMKEAWETYWPKIQAKKGDFGDVLIPIEIIFPTDEPGGYNFFQEKVLIINAARNNNAELKIKAKEGKRGFYNEIQELLNSALVDDVE